MGRREGWEEEKGKGEEMTGRERKGRERGGEGNLDICPGPPSS